MIKKFSSIMLNIFVFPNLFLLLEPINLLKNKFKTPITILMMNKQLTMKDIAITYSNNKL